MSQLRKCDICGVMMEYQPDLPDHWTSLSRISIDDDQMSLGQIDICNKCRSFLNEFYEDLEKEFVIDEDFLLKVSTTKEVLRFVLNREKI